MDVRQSTIETVLAVGQSFVVDTKQVKDSCVEVMDRDFVRDGFVSKLIRLTERKRGFDSCTSKPCREPLDVVVSPGCFGSLHRGHPAELGTPDNQGILQHASLLHIGQQRRSGLVKNFTVSAVFIDDLRVRVPITDSLSARLIGPIEQLDEADSFFQQSPRQDAVSRVRGLRFVRTVVSAIHLQGGLTFS